MPGRQQPESSHASLLEKQMSLEALTLIRQEVQHGLQQEGQVPDGQGRVPHPPGGVDQLVKQAHLHSGPASVRACHQSHTESQGQRRAQDGHGADTSIDSVNLEGPKTMPAPSRSQGRRRPVHFAQKWTLSGTVFHALHNLHYTFFCRETIF